MHGLSMSNNRLWNILNWNVRGMNSEDKWLALHQKIEESSSTIICLQETKREQFDMAYIKIFCPNRISKFEYLPSIAASGGILIAWNGTLLEGEVMFQNRFSLSIQFTCKLSNQNWILTNFYGPGDHRDKAEFIEWFSNIHMPRDIEWIIMGDFNFIRDPFDRNKPGGMSMKCCFLMKLSATLAWWICPLKVENTVGAICRKTLFLKSLTGFLVLLHG